MQSNTRAISAPQYRLLLDYQCWSEGGNRSLCKALSKPGALLQEVKKSTRFKPWQWPKQPIYFFADPHADAQAFKDSLVMSGAVEMYGERMHLTSDGCLGLFIIGGDCLDKGPSNLSLLRSVRQLIDTGANVKVLAGNHDVRLLMGLRTLGHKQNVLTEHFFLRMGAKGVPLLKEVFESYNLKESVEFQDLPGEKACADALLPGKSWYQAFPRLAKARLSDEAVERELARIKEKAHEFVEACANAELSMRDVYRTALKCLDIFLKPGGEFFWFFHEMQLVYREGSFLFLHAGVDDTAAELIRSHGVDHLNHLYKEQVHFDLFKFYYGTVANTMRTKYRTKELPLTSEGTDILHEQGIHAVVHGHRNRLSGQKISSRQHLLHIESDTTMDCNSRKKEGLTGKGAGVTIICPEGQVIGVSNDYPYAKIFEPEQRAVANIHAAK